MQLIEAGVENARLVPPDRFRFIGHEPDCVDNGGNLTGYMDSDLDWCVWGTFDPPRRIDYSTAQKNVIVHEALHAILYTLGYDCWADIDREEAGCPR
jgi:hypothetical protein